MILKDSSAVSLLQRAIQNPQIYKSPNDYVHCMDTHYVESFNNACLIFHDKRISFGTTEYVRRTHMAVLDWNENVDRDFTSISQIEDPKNPRRILGKKALVTKTFNLNQLFGQK